METMKTRVNMWWRSSRHSVDKIKVVEEVLYVGTELAFG